MGMTVETMAEMTMGMIPEMMGSAMALTACSTKSGMLLRKSLTLPATLGTVMTAVMKMIVTVMMMSVTGVMMMSAMIVMIMTTWREMKEITLLTLPSLNASTIQTPIGMISHGMKIAEPTRPGPGMTMPKTSTSPGLTGSVLNGTDVEIQIGYMTGTPTTGTFTGQLTTMREPN